MSNPTAPVSPTDPAAAGGADPSASSPSSPAAESAASTFGGSLDSLRKKFPKFYKNMIMSMSQDMITQMSRKNQKVIDELKKMRQENR